MDNFLMYDESDFEGFLYLLGLNQHQIDAILQLGYPEDATKVCIIRLDDDIEPTGDYEIKVERVAGTSKHNLKYTPKGAAMKTIAINAKVPPRNPDFRAFMEKIGKSSKK